QDEAERDARRRRPAEPTAAGAAAEPAHADRPSDGSPSTRSATAGRADDRADAQAPDDRDSERGRPAKQARRVGKSG
ncbi:MAG: hypothetical protein JWN84_4341, partial [Nocardioides sp.]|nr:hypothetical protein [Nocardioides sp.]